MRAFKWFIDFNFYFLPSLLLISSSFNFLFSWHNKNAYFCPTHLTLMWICSLNLILKHSSLSLNLNFIFIFFLSFLFCFPSYASCSIYFIFQGLLAIFSKNKILRVTRCKAISLPLSQCENWSFYGPVSLRKLHT